MIHRFSQIDESLPCVFFIGLFILYLLYSESFYFIICKCINKGRNSWINAFYTSKLKLVRPDQTKTIIKVKLFISRLFFDLIIWKISVSLYYVWFFFKIMKLFLREKVLFKIFFKFFSFSMMLDIVYIRKRQTNSTNK